MHVTARSDYAVHAMLHIAAAWPGQVSVQTIATAHGLPRKFLETVMATMRRNGLVDSHRGNGGGFSLARGPELITVGEIMRAIDGPLVNVRGQRPNDIAYDGCAEHLTEVWIAARAALRSVLDTVTLQQIRDGELPGPVTSFAALPGAWDTR
ncbi:Rrf2 family transcriptional regulator [Nakamurella flavida]|uniref:Rrf2 family transcriptional regulator n=1 Tax=Nakamurella flavida TaxID=363630 RepID=A0A939C406_9ACTN|nr:Rrf2 family transcriptional regulator [Nakamurella flavida]MBM9477586.1 Rrf2 family transcriptional regulator [Nakamurella flavida]MDP9779134.1 Rrf2 family protein [Nakamurella flavida]